MSTDIAIVACGVHSLGFALFHMAFWKLFGWPGTLRDTTLVNRAILQIANVQLVWVFLTVAALCFLYPAQMHQSALGRALLVAMSLFWLIRLVQQFVFLRVRHPLVHVLNLLFALGVLLWSLPLLA